MKISKGQIIAVIVGAFLSNWTLGVIIRMIHLNPFIEMAIYAVLVFVIAYVFFEAIVFPLAIGIDVTIRVLKEIFTSGRRHR